MFTYPKQVLNRNILNPIRFNNLQFKDRKVVHYGLLVSIVLLQIIAVLTWYNESVNEDKISQAFTNMGIANIINRYSDKANSSLVESQLYFNHYMDYKDAASLDSYLKTIQHTSKLLDSLKLTTSNNTEFKNILARRKKTNSNIEKIKTTIDSIINRQLYLDTKDAVQFRNFNSKDILDGIKTKTYIKVNKTTKKGLLTRILAAFTGKIEVQKEQLNTIVTMNYKNKVTKGTIEEQINHLISICNDYYKDEFTKLKSAFRQLSQKDTQLVRFNNQLLALSKKDLADYTNAANALKIKSHDDLQKRYATNKTIRSYTLVALILLMFLVSLLLFGFTRMAFEYEQKIVQAQEKIKESLDFKNRIIGMMSHEIRSPLTILSIYSQKISASIQDLTLKDSFKSIQFTTNSLLVLSNQILEYSKDEKYRLELRPKNFQLRTEVHQIIGSITSLVESHGNRLELSSNLTDDEVYSDMAKIHQLFYNILGNANKFTENGTIKILLEQEDYSDYEINLKATIEDNGIGIPEKDLPHVFESHYQGTTSGKTMDIGVGLGLNLCQEIVQLFDGSIHISSQEQQGTVVVFNLILSKV